MTRKEYGELFQKEAQAEYGLEMKRIKDDDPEACFAPLGAFVLAHTRATISMLEKMGVLKFDVETDN